MKRVLKSSLSILLAITIIFSAAYVGLSEVDFSGLFAVKVKAAESGTCGKYLTWTLDDNGTLTIRGTGAMYDYYHSSSPWYSSKTGIKSIVIGYGITNIGSYAFYNCSSLNSITIPNSVTSIGSYAFYNCSSLDSITIPNSVTSIGNSAFSKCTSLTSITIPDSVTSIGDFSFYTCTSLNTLVIPNSVMSIGDRAFDKCTNLTSITICDGITSIGDAIFQNCGKLTSITIPDSVTSIGNSAFSMCTSLTSITIPDSVTSIGVGAFYNTGYYNSSSNWCDNVLYIDKHLIGAKTDLSGTYAIKAGTKTIAGGAFDGCTSLTSIEIPDSVTSIGDSAFSTCTSLISVSIPNSVTSIGSYAFKDCISLTLNTIPDSVTSIGSYAFSGCAGLTSIAIPDSVTTIGFHVFKDCTSLSAVYITDIVKWCAISFGSDIANPLYYAKNLYLNDVLVTELIIPEGVTSIGDYAFICCTSLAIISISDSIESIGDSAFQSCSKLSSVHISDVANWCSISFGNPYSNPLFYAKNLYLNDKLVTELVIPDGVTSIGYDAFRDCASFTSVTIPNSVTSIGEMAFYNCTNLTDVYYTGSETDWEKITINSNNSLTNATIHYNYGAETIPEVLVFTLNDDGESYSVTDCDTFASGEIVIPSTYNGLPVTGIGDEAFNDCSKLTSIIIPDSITSIGRNAFYNTAYYNNENNWEDGALYIGNHLIAVKKRDFWVSKFVVRDGTKIIADGAIDLYINSEAIVIPESVTNIGEEAIDSDFWYVFFKGTQEQWENINIGVDNYLPHIHYETTDHVLSDWIVEREPTCAEGGYRYKNCIFCRYPVVEEFLDAEKHTPGDMWVEERPYCERSGEGYIHCTKCNELLQFVIIPPTGHNYSSEWTIDVQPTCTTSGSKSRHCLNRCEYDSKTDVTEILPLGHTLTDWIVDKNATCTDSGLRHKNCVSCEKTIVTETIPSKGHSSSDWIIETQATCTQNGLKFKECTECKVVLQVVTINSSGHNYSTEWTIDKAATCTENGSKSHHCVVCGDKTDITIIEATSHKYVVQGNTVIHPHSIIYKCFYCNAEKAEQSVSSNCIECNFTITAIDSSSYKLVSYIGDSANVVIPATYNGRNITAISNSCFKGNTKVVSVKIPYSVTSIGSLAFMNCSTLEKVFIPASTTSIGTRAFYGFTGSIYCVNGSYAHKYAVANNIPYVLVSIMDNENSEVDYENFIIRTTVQNCGDITRIINASETAEVIPEASYICGNLEFYGTGTIISVFDGDEYIGDYTLIVNGDTNGDSVCDVLDCFDVERAANGNADLTGVNVEAGDTNGDGIIDIADYQAIVNKAVS